jgi:hypothetical protein
MFVWEQGWLVLLLLLGETLERREKNRFSE